MCDVRFPVSQIIDEEREIKFFLINDKEHAF